MDFLERLFTVQKELKLNQKQFSELLGISAASYTEIVKRRSKPSLNTILNLCQICYENNISLNWLMLGIVEESNMSFTENQTELLNLYSQLPDREQIKLLGRIEDIIEKYKYTSGKSSESMIS